MEEQLAEGFKQCPDAASAFQPAGRYYKNRLVDVEEHDYEFHLSNGDIDIFGLFSGFGGSKVANYAMNRLAYEILSEQPITSSMTKDQIKDLLRAKFATVDARYNQQLEPLLSERFILKEDDKIANAARIAELEEEIRQGCTVLVVIRIQSDLYILSCGTCQLYAITKDSCIPLITKTHLFFNPEENERLENLGVSPHTVVGPTRALGDGFRRYTYNEVPEFASAKGPPVIADPEVFDMKIHDSWKHLILVSSGVIQNLSCCGINREDIPLIIFDNFKEEDKYSDTAARLTFNFALKCDNYAKSKQEENPNRSVNINRAGMSIICVKLRSDVYQLDDSLQSTASSLSCSVLGPLPAYVDLDSKQLSNISEEIEKLLIVQ